MCAGAHVHRTYSLLRGEEESARQPLVSRVLLRFSACHSSYVVSLRNLTVKFHCGNLNEWRSGWLKKQTVLGCIWSWGRPGWTRNPLDPGGECRKAVPTGVGQGSKWLLEAGTPAGLSGW